MIPGMRRLFAPVIACLLPIAAFADAPAGDARGQQGGEGKARQARHDGPRRVAGALDRVHDHDHVGALPELQDRCGAPSVGYKVSGLDSFDADVKLSDGDTVAGMGTIYTPGHAVDHVCFALAGKSGDRILFSADHVMSWSSSIVSPPGGDMKLYFDSLDLLLKRQDDVFLPGHGPLLRDPRKLVQELKDHRQMRENAIAEKLKEGPADTYTLMDSLYSQVNPRLRRAAERNVLAHLQKMEIEGKVQRDGELWRAA